MTRLILAVLLPVLGCASATTTGSTAGPAPAGQAAALTPEQCEAMLLELPRPDQFRAHLRTVTAEPHPTGSAAQLRVATYLERAMRSAGLDVERAEYDVYLPQLDGLVNEVEIVTPVRMRLPNREPALDDDPFTAHPDLLPGWNAYSGSGDVTGEVVYVNYGRREDFEELRRLGVSVQGRVVLARYGGNFRGYKVLFAEEHGAVGVIMFNDPGSGGAAPYPEGTGMSEWTIQRGSVLTLPWTGDPLTPFEPALPLDGTVQVQRLDPDSVAFHSIPVLPIGYGAAREILSRMDGGSAPAAWRSGIDVEHRLTGGSGLTVRVHVRQRLDFTRAVNVIGTVRGAELPDEWVILGAHYDPWGFGAHDPNGGTAMLLTLADALGTMAQQGCRPRRSIMIAHWDAEEYGIIGSTEWVEHYRDELARNAIAYINADASVSGPNFGASASPSLKQPIIDAARAVPYPGGGTVYEHWMRNARQGVTEPPLGNLGGGSDHVAFYTHVGVPSAGLSFGGSNGIYHSNYDTFRFFERFSDPDFVYGTALARVDGVLAWRLANDDIVPYDVVRYATDILSHTVALEQLAYDAGMNVQLRELSAAAEGLLRSARALSEARDRWRGSGADARRINAGMIALEKAFIHMDGLQGRPWSRSLYASPDPFSGYAAWMLPGLRYEVVTGDAAALRSWEAHYVAAVRELDRRMQGLAELLR
ncbi:MAG TPA: M28 family peptidase [Longimicrobiales bacterium]|nr:M28 family peptidase [Longimicrobiales bacterium]